MFAIELSHLHDAASTHLPWGPSERAYRSRAKCWAPPPPQPPRSTHGGVGWLISRANSRATSPAYSRRMPRFAIATPTSAQTHRSREYGRALVRRPNPRAGASEHVCQAGRPNVNIPLGGRASSRNAACPRGSGSAAKCAQLSDPVTSVKPPTQCEPPGITDGPLIERRGLPPKKTPKNY